MQTRFFVFYLTMDSSPVAKGIHIKIYTFISVKNCQLFPLSESKLQDSLLITQTTLRREHLKEIKQSWLL